MEFNLTKLLPANWLHAIGTTLFHSLWLGVLLSLFVVVILFSTKKAHAKLRYNLLTASMLAFILSTGALFYNALESAATPDSTPALPAVHAGNVMLMDSSAVSTNPLPVAGLNQVMALWDTYASQIVFIWFLIICIKSLQLIVSLNDISQLRKRQVYAAGFKWDKVVNRLSGQLGISKKIKVLQSGLAKVPMVTGHFKPLILIPLGLLNGLSDAEVEAILCHELAHIKRKDYLVNFMQNGVEIVFFFNPAVLWLSNLIREERENCCDDLAIAQLEDKRSYVKALITCQEFQLAAPSLAMAVTGRKNHLFNRISRMLFDTKTTLNKMEKIVLTLALIAVVMCTAAFRTVPAAHKSSISTSHAYKAAFQDTTKKKRNLTEADRKQAISDARQAQEDAKQAIIDSKQAVEDAKQAADDAKIAVEDAKQAKKDALQAQIDAKVAAEDARMHTGMDKKFNYSAQVQAVPATPATPAIPASPANPAMATPSVPATPPVPPVAAETTPLSPPKRNKTHGSVTTTTSSQRTVESVKSTDADAHDYKAIIKALIHDGIINNQDKLSYQLDKTGLIVNGIKQPESYHEKYKSRFLKRDNSAFLYYYENNSAEVKKP